MNPLDFLDAAARRFEADCARASEAQWQHRSGPGAWSMGDVAEHVTIANKLFVGSLRALQPLGDRKPSVRDEEIPYLFYRGDEPPAVGAPTGTWTTWLDYVAAFRASIAKVREEAAKITAPRTLASPHPVFGLLDGEQWMLFAGAHIERHRAQLIGLLRQAD